MLDGRGTDIMTAHAFAADRPRLVWIDSTNRINERVALRGMFEARKRIFVDRLGWDLAVLDGRFEIDRFDNRHARYVVLHNDAGAHLASARLLAMKGSSGLGAACLDWCNARRPPDDRIVKVTRFCISPDLAVKDYKHYRKRIVSAIATFALEHEISLVTAVLEERWLRLLLKIHRDAARLQPLRSINGNAVWELGIPVRALVDTVTLGFAAGQMDTRSVPGEDPIA